MTGMTPNGIPVTGELVTMPNGDHYIVVRQDITTLYYYVGEVSEDERTGRTAAADQSGGAGI